jgi:16S rRNA (cytidine1402-2'-O)-methyltransferase
VYLVPEAGDELPMKTRAPRPQPGRTPPDRHARPGAHAQEIPDGDDVEARPEGPGTLYVVPTPIGDYADLSLRALSILRSVDLIAAEDTREALKLLRHHGISVPLCSYHDFNEQARTHELIAKLRGGARIALVSDSGTPLISDPGYRVVRAVSQAGLPLVSLPGPCAAVTAAVASGLPVNQLLFVGFLPRKPGARTEALQALRPLPATVVLYEAPHRLLETLTAAVEVLGPRPAAICRSLTKSEEEVLRGPLDELVATLTARGTLYGEYTVVIGGTEDIAEGTWALAGRLIARLLTEGMEPRRVRDIVAETLDLPRGAVYDRILAGTHTA